MKQKSYFKAAPSLKFKLPSVEPMKLTKEQETLMDAYMEYVTVKMRLDALEDFYVRARPESKQHYADLMIEHARLLLEAAEKLARVL